MPYIQCPRCDSINVMRLHDNEMHCNYCGKEFQYYGKDTLAAIN